MNQLLVLGFFFSCLGPIQREPAFSGILLLDLYSKPCRAVFTCSKVQHLQLRASLHVHRCQVSLAAAIRVSVLMLFLLLVPSGSSGGITKQVGILPVRVTASASCASGHSSGLACARAFGFPGSWDLDLLLSCHTQVLACVEKGASCNSNDDDAQVIITAMVAAQPKKKQGSGGGGSPNGGMGPQYGIHPFFFSKGPRGKGTRHVGAAMSNQLPNPCFATNVCPCNLARVGALTHY